MLRKHHILWLDGLGGLGVGILVLIFPSFLSRHSGLPLQAVQLMGFANVAYGSFSTTLALKKVRSRASVTFLIVANLLWPCFCLGLTWFHWKSMTLPGLVWILGEGVYVNCLGQVEWRWREALLVP